MMRMLQNCCAKQPAQWVGWNRDAALSQRRGTG
jgi:hypothetical protein